MHFHTRIYHHCWKFHYAQSLWLHHSYKNIIYSRELPVLDFEAAENNGPRNEVKRRQAFPGNLLIYDPMMSNLSIQFRYIRHGKTKRLVSMNKLNFIFSVPVLKADLHESYCSVFMNPSWLPRGDKWGIFKI